MSNLHVMRGFACGLGICALACGGGGGTTPKARPSTTGAEQPAAAPAGEAAPQKVDVAAMFARENEPAALHDIAAGDGSVKGRIEAAAPPAVTNEEGFVMIVARLLEHDVQCFVYPEAKDGAEVARVLVGATLAKAIPAEDQQWVDVHGDQVEGWPYLIARAHYRFMTEAGMTAGDFKLAVSVRDATTVACLLDAPGYYASFERVVKSLLTALDSAPNRGITQPVYAEITRSGLPGRIVTLSRSTVRDEDGKTVKRDSAMQLMILPTGALRTSDEANVETSQRGRVVSGTYASASMGQADHVLQLTGKGDLYTVSGTLQDKPISGEFRAKGGLPDEERIKSMVCRVRDGKQASVDVIGYEPSLDPQQAISMAVRKSTTPDAHLVLSFAAAQTLEMRVNVDEDCDIDRGAVVTAGTTIGIERLWHQEKAR